jgi:hypothetical protein
MSFVHSPAFGRFLALVGTTFALAACGSSTSPAPVATLPPTTYTFLQTVSGVYPPGTKTLSFDIGFVDETVNQYYLADKVTNGVDVVNSLSSQFLGTAGAGAFQGLGTTVAGFARAPNGGPNGVVSLGKGLVAAGDGNSTLKIVSSSTIAGTTVASIPVPNPYTGPNLPKNICQGTVGGTTGVPTVGAGNFRVDELAYDPTDNVIAAVSDNACPVFISFFQGQAPFAIVGQVALPTANGGGEQTVWDPAQGLFLTAIPSTTTNPNGEVDVFSPKTLKLVKVIPLSISCNPSGMALGFNETMVAACANSMVTFNAVTGQITNNYAGPSCDEVWYSPGTNRFYGADTGRGMLVILDGNGNFLSATPTASGAHSVAVEAVNDHVFVPQAPTSGLNLGIAIYDH